MMKNILLILILITSGVVLLGRNRFLQKVTWTRVFNNVITDFANTSKLFKVDDIFDIYITDTEDYYAISISGVVNKIYPPTKDIIGTYDELILNKYIIHNDGMQS